MQGNYGYNKKTFCICVRNDSYKSLLKFYVERMFLTYVSSINLIY